jgi:hypothetical protein
MATDEFARLLKLRRGWARVLRRTLTALRESSLCG